MNPLLKLLAKNQNKSQAIKAETNGDEATIYVYGVLVNDDYFGGVLAESFVKELNSITAKDIHIRLQSPGGDVWAGVAMAQAMIEHPSNIIVHIDGSAASAATFLVIAADESIIANGGEFMIHKAWTIAAGNEDDFTSMADQLRQVDQTIIDKYQAKTNKTPEEIKQLMADETSFFGQKAVDAGFVDKIYDGSIENKIDWDLSAYNEGNRDIAQPSVVAEPEAKKQDEITIEEPEIEQEPEKPDLSAHYRQLEVVTLTA